VKEKKEGNRKLCWPVKKGGGELGFAWFGI